MQVTVACGQLNAVSHLPLLMIQYLYAVFSPPPHLQSPSLAGLSLPMATPVPPISPSPSVTFAPGGPASPPTPIAGAGAQSSTAAAAAALANLLSVAASAQQAAGGGMGLGMGAAGMGLGVGLGGASAASPALDPAALSVGNSLAALGLASPAAFIPQGLPPIGLPSSPSAGLGLGLVGGSGLPPLGPAAATPATPALPVPALANTGLASAPATPTAAHPSSKLVRRSVSDVDAFNRRLPIFARLAEREELGEQGAERGSSPATSAGGAGSSSAEAN